MQPRKARASSGASRQPKPLSLNSLAEDISHFIQEKVATTFQDVADMIVEKITQDDAESNNDKTTRRRVYDVLNVFLAAGVITKEGKQIRHQPLAHISEMDLMEQDRALSEDVEHKKALLIQRIKLLLAYKSLMVRNSQQRRPASAIQMPAIIVGFNSNISGGSKTSLDGRSVVMHASENPVFYSPMDVFERMGLPQELQRSILKETRLASCEDLVFQD